MQVSIFSLLLLLALIFSPGCMLQETKRDEPTGEATGTLPARQYSLNISSLKDAGAELGNIPKTDEAYIIVHPSYYLFFQKKPFFIAPSAEKNVVQVFSEIDFPRENTIFNLMKLYEAQEMAFISSARNEHRLVILVLPGRYERSRSFLYKNSSDEYARYLNEASAGSDTVFYIESSDTDSGKINRSDMDILVGVLKSVGVQNVLLGGGYVGRCQEEFYRAFSKEWPVDNLALIPELSAFSPNDITDATARMLLTQEQRLNTQAANYFIKNGGIKTLGVRPNLRNMNNPKIIIASDRSAADSEDTPH